MGFVDQNVNVLASVDLRRHVAELVDHGNDDSAVIGPEEALQFSNVIGMRNIVQTDGGEVLQHLIFELIAVNHQQDGRLVRSWRFEEQFGRFDHRIGLTAALGVPDESTTERWVESATNYLVNSGGLVLSQDILLERVFLFRKEDEVFD
jgi:hypothetical protein